jgi:carbamoyl-phosphate synthase large subunit
MSAPAMAVADKAFEVPAIYAPNYIESIFSICTSEKINAVISLNDLELPLLAAAHDRFQKAGVVLVLSSEKVINDCFDKWKTYEFAKSHDIKVPNTYLSLAKAKTAIRNKELTFPLVVKPRWGSASIGLTFPEDMEELDLAYRLLGIRLSRTILAEASKNDIEQAILIQEKIYGKEYGIDVLNDFNCKPVQVFVKEKLSMRAGETDKAVLRSNPHLEAIGFKIGESLGHLGNLDCDVFEMKGQYYLLELNPRFGGGYPFSQMSGARYPDAIIAWLEGACYDFKKNKKTYDIIYAKCDTLINVSDNHREKSVIRESDRSISTGSYEMIQSNDVKNWQNIVYTSYKYDFYHTLEYHLISEEFGGGKHILFVYQDNSHRIALPLLLRPIHNEAWFPQGHQEVFDVTSVYGYTGPILSHKDLPEELIERFSVCLINTLRELNVVNLFTRLHPLIDIGLSFDNFFKRRIIGETVSIDLSIPSDAQVSQFCNNHKRGIRKLRKEEFKCFEDVDRRYLNDFIQIYFETMDRVEADKSYYFSRGYFSALLEKLHGVMHLFVCTKNDEVVCAGLFSLCGSIIQYHLGGTRNSYLKYSPMKLLFDVVREWGIENHASVFHLGGGFGSSKDSLMQFKSGFSNRRHPYAVWEKILMPEEYKLLCDAKADYNRKNNLQNCNDSFFPLYRSKVKTIPQ